MAVVIGELVCELLHDKDIGQMGKRYEKEHEEKDVGFFFFHVKHS